jgi:hypothetical protein
MFNVTLIALCFCFALLRLVCHVLPVSLDCPFVLPLWVFSNVYVEQQQIALFLYFDLCPSVMLDSL